MTDTFRKDYTPLSELQKANVANVKHEAEQLLNAMSCIMPDERSERSRCMAIARTNLEQAVMWAVKGITTKEDA